jgi:uncharacterized membrane protein (DUF441 family)
MCVLMVGKVRLRRLVIANAVPHMIHRSVVDSGMLIRIVLGHFCSYLTDAGIQVLLNKPSLSSCIPAFPGMRGDERKTR